MQDLTSGIKGLRFRQWITAWDSLKFEPKEFRRKPSPDIFLFSMPADQLCALSGVFHRERHADGGATGIQRGHDKTRSALIRDFVQFGYPYSDLSPSRRDSFDSEDLRKPGWLPTAIVVNILTENDKRRKRKVAKADLVKIEEEEKGNLASIKLPANFSGAKWDPADLHPIEVIDGQHRLYAFAEDGLPGDFELPVVAFHGLDIGWQAYLFWSINVSPKKINPSHAFDLYPLLRSQDWLDKFAESSVYREARAQELTEFLYRHDQSPWRNRINMLGEKGNRSISQAAWVRSLTGTFLSAGRGRGIKGLFGCNINDIDGPLMWTRAQQASFLIYFWKLCEEAVKSSRLDWASSLRNSDKKQPKLAMDEERDLAFAGTQTMLSQEQGVRALLTVCNELVFQSAVELALADWDTEQERDSVTSDEEISVALTSLQKQTWTSFLKNIAEAVVDYDWRSADASGLSDDEKLKKRAFRGSGGYAALRSDLLKFLARSDNNIGECAKTLLLARG